ncbi:MAG: DinB family protein [Anaerolineae bacterium]|nr:DinB family protein [Anaerolineae bacterium]
MTHPLVDQLRFTRSEFVRALEGITDEEARRRLMPMNSISWMIGHLAWQEQRYWLTFAQGQTPHPELNQLTANGAPASTPPLDEMWQAWHAITQAADPYLDTLTTEALLTRPVVKGKPIWTTVGSLMLRTTYHYWYHIGEAQAVRQMLGHTDLLEFVGDIDTEAPYTPEQPIAL